ncbi:MAG: sporulation integral membrane protein YtvI [Peptococcaceae bacterium]|nr:MAG: sporulation integral membrane protein YtvI [Peptococcaceae bacterium]
MKPVLYALGAILTLFLAAKYLLPLLVPFILALIFSVLMEPVVRFLQAKVRLSRSLSVIVAMLLVFGGVGLALTLMILQLVAELIQLSGALSAQADVIKYFYEDLISRVTTFYGTLPSSVTASLENSVTSLTTALQGLVSRAANSILQVISLVPGTIIVIVVSALATYFISRDRHLIGKFFILYLPESWGEKSVLVMREIAGAFVGYLRAQAILVSLTTILSIAGLYLIGAKYALTLGLLIGFFDLIPVLGPATIYLPWIIFSFSTGATVFGVKLTVLYLLVMLVRQVLEAKVVSASLGLHPLATLVAMYIGLKTLGFVGLVLGPIFLIALQAILKAGFLKS